MEKNTVITVTAEGLGSYGEGIAHVDGFTVFVPYLLKGERASVKILKSKGNIAYGKVEELFTPAEERVRPRCAVFPRCGGCQLQHLRYRDQLAFKAELVKNTLKKVGGVDFPVSPCERSDREYGYRNKLQLPVGRANGQNAVGFFAERSHRIIPIEDCPIHPAWTKPLISALLSFMEKCGLDGYDEATGEGQIRRIVVRELKRKYLVTLVTTVPELKGIDYFCHLLEEIFPEFSVFLNINTSTGNAAFGEQFLLVRGQETYPCSEGGILFEAGPNTFVQVNDNVRAKLYARVVEGIDAPVAIDCYAGGGLLTAMLAKKCGKAYGIEVVPEATSCADTLARANGLEGRMTNICARVEDALPALLKEEKNAAVVLDPPRAGVERSVISAILAAAPPQIVMISCNPATLARDVGLLCGTLTENERGELVKTENPHTMYEIEEIKPYDMFAQTRHVETLVVLSHKKPDGHIGVKVEFGEEEGQISLKEVQKRAEERKPKEKVTYKMIQEYTEKTYGFKVHTAYIAEVKRSLGLPMYDAPNAVEELKRPRSHPSPQMVEAIKETLKHFEII